jgi:hypothetical protein
MGKEDSIESKGKIRMTITPANKLPNMRTVLEAPSSCDVNELAELSSKLRQIERFSIENVSSVLPSMETQKVDNRNLAVVACLGSRTSGAGEPAVVMDTEIEV